MSLSDSYRLMTLRPGSILRSTQHNLHPTPLFHKPEPPRLITVDIPPRPMPGRKCRPSIDPAFDWDRR